MPSSKWIVTRERQGSPLLVLLLRYSTGAVAAVAMPGHSARASFSQAGLSPLGLPRSTYEVMMQSTLVTVSWATNN